MQKKNKLKKIFINMPIGHKMSLVYTSVFFLMLFVATVAMIINSWTYYRSISKSEINEVFNKVEQYILKGGEINDWEINNIIDNKYINVKIFDSHGILVKENKENDPPLAEGKKPPIDENNKHFSIKMIENLPYMVAQRDVMCNGSKYIIMVFRQYGNEYEILRITYSIFICENIIAIAVAFFIGKYITEKMLKPIRDITKAAEEISAEDLSRRIEVPIADDEMKTLAVTFNDMIDRLEVFLESQKQFISDASHELKTPISVIQGYAGLLDRWGKSDEAVLEESISSIKSETEYMSDLIKQLLFLARSDSMSSTNPENIHLKELVEEIYKEISVLDINAEFSYKIEEDICVNADYHLMKQLMWIFVENAVKYSGGKKSKIFVKVTADDKNAYISVEDNGIGIAEEDIEHIFERFYRGDKSRNKSIDGIGLGLSIAKRIIDEHKGAVSVESTVGEGTKFVVSLPL